MSAICSTADDIPMATPEKAPADTSDEMLVAPPVAETGVSGTDDDEDNTANDATSEQENEAPPSHRIRKSEV